jgi:DnaJ-class molecular chaperone
MLDPYRVLNVPRSADAAAIKAAYRKLAKTLHPDANPGDPRAEQRFKDVTRAYHLLSDPKRRAQFDRGEIDVDGRRRAPFGFGGFGGAASGEAGRGGAGGFESFFEKAFGSGFRRGGFGTAGGGGAGSGGAEAVFEELLRNRSRGPRDTARQRVRGADVRERLELDFMAAARGGRQRLYLDDGRTLEVEVPPATTDGQVLRLKGQGTPGFLGGEPGDVLVEVAVKPHPYFTLKGHHVQLELPISLDEAVLGASITVPTIDGNVRVHVPPMSNSGQTLRLKGRGLPGPKGTRGDQLVRLVIHLPERPDPALKAELRRCADLHPYRVRRRFEDG